MVSSDTFGLLFAYFGLLEAYSNLRDFDSSRLAFNSGFHRLRFVEI